MALITVNAGDTFNALLINQLIAVLQQPSGGQEKGHYKIQGNMYTSSGLFLSCCPVTISRNTTPISCSIDTSDVAPNNLNSPSVGHLTMGAMQVFASTAAASARGYVGGIYTMQY